MRHKVTDTKLWEVLNRICHKKYISNYSFLRLETIQWRLQEHNMWTFCSAVQQLTSYQPINCGYDCQHYFDNVIVKNKDSPFFCFICVTLIPVSTLTYRVYLVKKNVYRKRSNGIGICFKKYSYK